MLSFQLHEPSTGVTVSYVSSSQGVALAKRRLTEIDLSEDSRQPMLIEVGTIWRTYNGEIAVSKNFALSYAITATKWL
jgi:asparagine synthetase B (glutamine-hydrolysing)